MRIVTRQGIRLIAVAIFACTGCHAVRDPSCEVHRELADVRCRDAFFAPELDLSGVTETSWFRCPPAWRPHCGPVFAFPAPPRHIPPPVEVFALPASRYDARD